MRLRNIIESISKKLLIIICSVIVIAVVLYMVWQHNKYGIVNDKLKSTVSEKTGNLYKIKYDSLHFDELTGEAYLQGIHVGPDTSVIQTTKLDDLPYVLLDITIASLKVNGVKTDKALLGKQMSGDSVLIENPNVIIYFLKPLEKKTNINAEAKTVYEEILGNLNRIQAGHVIINNIQIQGIEYFQKEKVFNLTNGNIQLTDVLIDSAHNLDTTRTLFCKQIALQIASFIKYNNARPEVSVKQVNYSGQDYLLSFDDIAVNRFESANGDSIRFLHAANLALKGIDANEFVKNKNIIVDSIECKEIMVYQPSLKNLQNSKGDVDKKEDTTGFTHVYSIEMKHLGFPKITIVTEKNSDISIGNIGVTINEVKADEIIDIENNPLDYGKEAAITCDNISINSKDGFYKYGIQNASINSLQKQLSIGSVSIKPLLSETAFADKAAFQKDRYDMDMKGIALKNIDMKNLIAKKIFASDLSVNAISAKIYRDLRKPLSGKAK